VGANISPYQEGNVPADYDPARARKLLVKKDDIKKYIGLLQEKGLTLVPLKLYTARGKVKLELGLAKSKKAFDKREAIKKRDVERSMKRGAV
jgi:SsrA-binding protein